MLSPRRNLQAFTLVELLVVVAIIGILALLGLGAAGRAMDGARTTQTIANLKQLQTANLAHAADNDGWFVKAFDGQSFQNGWRGDTTFLSYIERSGRNGWTDPSKIVRSGFKPVNSLIAYNIPKAPGANGPVNYWSSGPMRLRQNQLLRPATTIAFIDSNDWWVDPGSWNGWVSASRNDGANRNGAAMVAYRNNGKAAGITFAGNVVMLSRADMNHSSPDGGWRWYYNGSQWN